ncbi:MAG: RNA polymerase sigma factor FliA [Gammaproteobacteria bacterium CG22_combo_CG10-13_8_21_14_all_40_8]|nr:MAG: RNA polymerase sigma factor FliA [Gammaproteobacteria bacterium CG22_combo_CG10-13_8_21_14_all_40_8]
MYNNQQSQQQLVIQHAGLVKRIALHVLGRLPANILLDDLIQAGMLGLLEASSKFDQTKGASFETYAGIRIRGSIIDEVRRGDWAPRSVHKNGRHIAKAISEIEQRTGQDAKDEDVAKELGVDVDQYHQMVKDVSNVRLIGIEDAGLDEENLGISGENDGNPLKNVYNLDFKETLAQEIDKLPEREKLTMALYYDEELNLKEIGAVLGVSESRVCQLHGQALSRLKSRLSDWN